MKGDAENVEPESRPLKAPASLLGQLLAENGCHFGAGPALGHLHVLTSAR
jgi:hypothetical protein